MRRLVKRAALLTAGAGLAGVAYTQVYDRLRAQGLTKKYVAFRAQQQAAHDRVDADFNHQDRVVNGLNWHYVDEGARDGEVILFLHGLPESWYSWRHVLPLVDHDYRLIAVDMKGYGRSDHEDRNYDWHTVARQTLDFMDDLGIKKFYVVSHDWGTVIGSILVGNYPERILGYVRMEVDLASPKSLRDWITFYRLKPQWLFCRSYWFGRHKMQDPGKLIDKVYPPRMTTRLRPEDRDYLVYEFSRPGVAEAVAHYYLARNWDLPAATDRIAEDSFPFPILQLQATEDDSQPQWLFHDAASRFPNVKLEWVTGASHFDNLDQPAQVAEAINRFVHETSAPQRVASPA
ncbi:alpha/beta fold hydrolase [Actinopolymorpha cephalotaxi]|nr:alpha/beta fold hydrolase [Actinopolymorpha cephalotaxi]NYH85703.1 pimeloyl-ACP methyl ester carboxylesterase [Actinopolymorpha cephalotaxi]